MIFERGAKNRWRGSCRACKLHFQDPRLDWIDFPQPATSSEDQARPTPVGFSPIGDRTSQRNVSEWIAQLRYTNKLARKDTA